MFPQSFSLISSILFAGLIGTTYLANAVGYDQDPAQGWYFYQTTPEVEVTPAPTPAPEVVAEPESRPEPQETSTPPAHQPSEPPTTLSTAWIRKNLQRVLDHAMDTGDPEAVRAYVYLNRYMSERASAFALQSAFETMKDPMVDGSSRRSVAGAAVRTQRQLKEESKKRLLNKAASISGLWYIYKSDCPYCLKQGPLLTRFRELHGFTVVAISVDGGAPPSGKFDSVRHSPEAVDMLAINATPAIFLVDSKSGNVALVGQGFLSYETLEDRTLFAAMEAGVISKEEHDMTRIAPPPSPAEFERETLNLVKGIYDELPPVDE